MTVRSDLDAPEELLRGWQTVYWALAPLKIRNYAKEAQNSSLQPR
jgi:hypothetical protein